MNQRYPDFLYLSKDKYDLSSYFIRLYELWGFYDFTAYYNELIVSNI